MRLLVATRSAHKLREIREILGKIEGIEVVGPDDVGLEPRPEEDHLEPHGTFRENAASKARYFHTLSGLPTVSDDSGIEIDALGGAPGVRSKRFSPDEGLTGLERDRANNRHLLERLEGVPTDGRGARYVCEAVLVDGDNEVSFRGEAPGLILTGERGSGGFGYDPLFYDPELGRTFASLERGEKNAHSHRGKAFRALAAYVKSSLRASG